MARSADWGLSKDILNGIAVTSFIFAVSVYLPFVGSFGIYVLPLPIIFYRLKLGRGNGAIIPVASMCLMAIIIGDISFELIFLFELLLAGFVIGELFELNLSVEKIVLYTSAVVIVTGIFCLLMYSNTVHTSVVTMASEYVAKSLELVISIYRDMGTPEKDIQIMMGLLDDFQYILVRIIPAMIIATAMIIVWANLLLIKPFLILRGIANPDFGPLNTWKAPETLVWGFIASGVMLFLPAKSLMVLGLNCIIILMTIYFFQGIAIISFYLEKKQVSRLLKFSIYSFGFIVLRQLLIFFVSIIGLFDIWLDFRKLENKINNQEN